MILCNIAKQLMPDSPIDWEAFKSHPKVRAAIAKTVPGMEALADIDVAKREFHIGQRVMHEPQFGTARRHGRTSSSRRCPPRPTRTSR